MNKLWPISGGIHPPQNKQQTQNKPIIRLPTPECFYLSLFQDRGAQLGEPLQPLVTTGAQVKKGQLIAESKNNKNNHAVPLHAPTSGVIGAITQRPLNHPSGNLGAHLELISDGLDQWCPLTPNAEPFKLEKTTLLTLIQKAGICGMGGAGFPTAAKLATPFPIHTLIINGTECEPYITADDCLMQEEADDIISGALLCAHLLGASKIQIAIEDNKPLAIKNIYKALPKNTAPHIELTTLPTIYPSGGSKQLVQILTGQQVPSGQQAASLGLMIINVATVRAVWRAVRWGEPLIERATTFTGNALKQQNNVWVKIGTPVNFLLNQLGWDKNNNGLLILGGPLMGFNLNAHAALGKTSNCVIAASTDEMPAPPMEAPCIRCGQCDSVCPAQLLPQQLFWYAKNQDFNRLKNHNLFDCIECGACSYVCPSAIPLVQYYRHAKAEIRTLEFKKTKADQARTRFEAHQTRVQQAEIEKNAKRQARQTANTTIQAQLKQAAPTPSETTQKEQPTQDIEAKLNRHKQSAQERLLRLTLQAEEEKIPARKEKLAASIKQAQLRLNEAEQKLAESNAHTQSAKLTQKLQASPHQQAEQALNTLKKQLTITEEKLREAEKTNAPSLSALTLAVQKLQQKIQQATLDLNTLPTTPTQPDAATLAAAEQALARLAAKKQQSPEEKQQALKESIEKRIQQLHLRISTSDADKIPILNESLAALEARLKELER
ncbi:MAG: hypothetical protein RL497_1003 [Pseudomonadota bacterium]